MRSPRWLLASVLFAWTMPGAANVLAQAPPAADPRPNGAARAMDGSRPVRLAASSASQRPAGWARGARYGSRQPFSAQRDRIRTRDPPRRSACARRAAATEWHHRRRLVRDDDGKQHRFVGIPELREYIDSHGGRPLLVFSPLEYVRHLTNSDLVHTDVLDDNGELAITVVRSRNADHDLVAARWSRSISAVPIPVSGTDSQ